MGSCGKGGGIGGRQEKREGGAEGAERKRKSLTPEGVSYNVGKRPRTEGGAARSTALPAAGREEGLCYGGVHFNARPLTGLRNFPAAPTRAAGGPVGLAWPPAGG